MVYEMRDYRCEFWVNGKLESFDVISGSITVGKTFRRMARERFDEVLEKNDTRRLLTGIDYTLEQDGNFYMWRVRPYVPDPELLSVDPFAIVTNNVNVAVSGENPLLVVS